MVEPILEVNLLTKKFGDFLAVNDISFSVKEGEVVGLLGPNGAGKTTTLSMILGNITPTSGSIKVFGKIFSSNREEILQQMNYSSAYVRAPLRIKVWEHLYIFALLYQVENPSMRVNEMLKTFDLEKHKDTFAGDLSAGNMARLNLCKAFINEPKLVLLDEPTSSLDPEIADRVRRFITNKREKFGTTILITSHNMSEIEELCDWVIFMNKGKIIAKDTPEGLSKKIKKTKIRLMINDGNKRIKAYCVKEKLPLTQDGRYTMIEVKEDKIAYILNGLAAAGVKYSEISIDKPTLEDFFIEEIRDEN